MSKPAFDPNKPFEVVDAGKKPAFDPNQPFEVVAGPERKELTLGGEIAPAFAEGVGDIFTAGHQPQIKAGLSKAISAITPFTPQQVLATIDKPIPEVLSGKAYEGLREEPMSYVELRDEAARRGAEVKAKDPVGAGLGMLTGALVTPTGTANTLKGAIGKGALGAALYNPGDKEGEISPIQVEERLEQAAVGGLFGLGGKILAGSPEAAKKMAARALGRGTKQMKSQMGTEGLKEAGKMALDTGVVGVIPKTINQMAAAAQKVRESVGAKIGSVIDDIDGLEKQAIKAGKRAGVDKRLIADKVKTELLDPDTAFASPEMVGKVEKRIKSFLKTGGQDPLLPTKGIHIIKTKLGKEMQGKGAWKRLRQGIGTEEDFISKKFYDTLSDAVVDASEVTAKQMASPLAGKIKDLNKEYTAAVNMNQIVKSEVDAGNTNNLLNLTSLILGTGAGVGTQDPVTGLLTAGGVQGLKRFGPQVAAKALQSAGGLSKLLSGRLAGTLEKESDLAGSLRKALNLKNNDAIQRRLKGE